MRPPARTTRSASTVRGGENELPAVLNAVVVVHSKDPLRRAIVTGRPGSNRSSRTGTPFSDKEKKPRHRMTDKQLERLEALYQQDTHPTREQKQALGDDVGMDTRTVTVWFQNRRQLAKKQSLIVNTLPQPMCRQPLSAVTLREGNSDGRLSRQPSVSSLSQSSSNLDRRTPQPYPFAHQSSRELWELLPSTPPSVPMSAVTSAMPSPLARRLSDVRSAPQAMLGDGSKKRKPILEWACARVAKRQRLQPSEDMDEGDDFETDDEGEFDKTLVDFDAAQLHDKLGKKKYDDDMEIDIESTDDHLSAAKSLNLIAIPPEYKSKFDSDILFGASLLLMFRYSFKSAQA